MAFSRIGPKDCPACLGRECEGGGNDKCVQRNRNLSAVAGIVDVKGGVRVVVTQRWRMRFHVGKKERLVIVPDFHVREPVAWNEIPFLCDRVQRHVQQTLAPVNHCGECSACCYWLSIDDPPVKKPIKTLCQHYCKDEHRCKIYSARPKTCSDFKCEWLKSQARNDRMAPELRPDRCGAMFRPDTTTNDPLIIEVHGEPNADAWTWINAMQAAGYKARKIVHYV